MKKALLVIDLQKDYFPGGLYPLWDTDRVLENIVSAIGLAREQGIEVIHIQHIANPDLGLSPFFNKDTVGAEIVPEVMAAAPDAPVVRKEYIDAFVKTTLEEEFRHVFKSTVVFRRVPPARRKKLGLATHSDAQGQVADKFGPTFPVAFLEAGVTVG